MYVIDLKYVSIIFKYRIISKQIFTFLLIETKYYHKIILYILDLNSDKFYVSFSIKYFEWNNSFPVLFKYLPTITISFRTPDLTISPCMSIGLALSVRTLEQRYEFKLPLKVVINVAL